MPEAPLSDDALALLAPWPGPYGGLPPLDRLAPATLEAAFRAAVAEKRAEVGLIAADPSPPTFANTALALEDAGGSLRRVLPLLALANGSLGSAAQSAVARTLAPLAAQLDDEIAQDERLCARLEAVSRERLAAALSPEHCRLVDVLLARHRRHGATLDGPAKARLAAIHARLAELSAAFGQNLDADAAGQVVFIDEEAELDGLNEALRRSAAATAVAFGRPGAWAVANDRAAVWGVLTHATHRGLRERVWRLWNGRGTGEAGGRDNAPLVVEMLALRGEKAKLLGFASYAHFALDDRMVRDPAAVADLLQRTWAKVLPAARSQLADYRRLADRDGAPTPLAPWDRQFYAERLRRERFGLDGAALAAHLPLDAVIEAMFWTAGRVHGLVFERLADAPVVHPSVRVYGVSRAGGEEVGVLYLDLIARPGKGHGSYQSELRTAESFRGRVLPIASIHSSVPAPTDAGPVLLPWDYANVFFHEFGHALHMLLCGAAHPSLGSVSVAWDFVELPALLNERWLIERETLERFARHHATGAPWPPGLQDRLEAALRHDRVFSLNLDYLLPAIVDLRLHCLADGRSTPIDAVRVERELAAELGMPQAWDQVMQVQQSVHSFAGAYAAGVYVYLWADVMAADVAEAFVESPGGLFDPDVAERWRRTVLQVGSTVPAGEAFREFRGRDPDPSALLRRFGLAG